MTCNCNEFIEVITENLIHYGKLVCKDCGKFKSWIKDPNKKPYKEICLEAVSKAIKYDKEPRGAFIDSLISFYNEKGVLTPNQLECLEDWIDEKEL